MSLRNSEAINQPPAQPKHVDTHFSQHWFPLSQEWFTANKELILEASPRLRIYVLRQVLDLLAKEAWLPRDSFSVQLELSWQEKNIDSKLRILGPVLTVIITFNPTEFLPQDPVALERIYQRIYFNLATRAGTLLPGSVYTKTGTLGTNQISFNISLPGITQIYRSQPHSSRISLDCLIPDPI